MEAIFAGLCPHCEGQISAERLAAGYPCDRCLPSPLPDPCRALGDRPGPGQYATLCRVRAEAARFAAFFQKRLGFPPWSLQLSWAKRVFLDRSFAILAPTGVGKTTFGLAMAAYLPTPSYIVVPTRLLVEELAQKLQAWAPQKRALGFTGKARERQRIAAGDFDVLITTSMFLQRNADLLMGAFPAGSRLFVFVDDVDSLLKASRNVDRLLQLLGFSPEEIAAALAGKEVAGSPRGVLVVSSATAQPRTKRVILFQRLLGFEVQRPTTALRNVVDLQEKVPSFAAALEKTADLLRRCGPGAFVYVSLEVGRSGAEKAVEFFNSSGIPAILYTEFNDHAQRDFKSRKLWAVVGVAHGSNPLVRGIDLPEAVRYAVFLGVPVMLFPAEVASLAPAKVLDLLLVLRPVLPREEVEEWLEYLRRYLTLREEDLPRYPHIRKRVEEMAKKLEQVLASDEELRELARSGTVSLAIREGRRFFLVADAQSYLQASGRTSRLSPWGLTRGLSVLFWWDEGSFRNLGRRLALFTAQEVEFVPLNAAALERVLREVDEDREKLRKMASGLVPERMRDILCTSLLIVESPNKAHTIASFFGRPQRRLVGNVWVYEVTSGDRLLLITATMGHVTDLVEEGGIYGVLEVDGRFVPVYGPIRVCRACQEQTTSPRCPRCGQPPEVDKLQTLRALRGLALEVDEVLVGTDPDSEGEKIAWDVYLALRPFNPNIRRIEFHEVTPRAIREALASPREVVKPLVHAQMIRRIADRWIGFSLSQHLQERFGSRNLSAGRVQTPVLGWVVAREEERRRRKALILASLGQTEIRFELDDPQTAQELFPRLGEMLVERAREWETEIPPLPPFSTATLLAEAARTLRFSPGKTMDLAQELFEAGLITYHRTDSVRVSETGMALAKRVISELYGPEFFHPRSYGEGGAHECIRPTRPLPPEELRELLYTGRVKLTAPTAGLRLYELVWRRFLASQMRPTVVRKVLLRFSLDGFREEREFITSVEKHGFDVVSPIATAALPPELRLSPKELREVPAAAPFTQGELVALMRERGLGRPSTYARIVETLLARGYVREHKGFLFPTALGRKVYGYLTKRFPYWTGEEFTRKLEAHMDAVETGQARYQDVLQEVKRVVEEVDRHR